MLSTDVAEFDDTLRAAAEAADPERRKELLLRAVSLYTGELLPGFYEEWLLEERTRLAEANLDLLCRLAATLVECGEAAAAIEFGRRGVTLDPVREDAHCALMRAYAGAARVPEALRQFHELEAILQRELGSTPAESTRELMQRMARSQAPYCPRVCTPQIGAAENITFV